MAPAPLTSRRDVAPMASHLLRRVSSSIANHAAALSSVIKRQANIIPTTYSNINDSMPPGNIIGITLGSVAGFLLILWLIYTLMGGNMVIGGAGSEGGSVVIQRKRSRRGSSRRSETTERRERVVPVVERVIIEERRESRPPPPPVNASSVGSEDEVVVIEEHSPPPRRSKSKRESRDSGYRTVDPMAYGGGDRPFREVDRRGSGRSRR